MLQNRLLPILLTLLLFGTTGYMQTPASKPARILFLVDASGSMSYTWHEEDSRFKAATQIIEAIMDSMRSVNDDVTFGVRVFGTQYAAEDKNCFDSRLEVNFRPSNQAQIMTRFKYLQPKGYSPIAWSLKEAAVKDFTEDDYYAYSLILLTDGGESCGGDICATVTQLLEKKISFRPYILSLIDYAPLQKEFDCLGTYMSVTKPADIAPAISKIIGDNRQVLSVKDPRQDLQTEPVFSFDTPPPVSGDKPLNPELTPPEQTELETVTSDRQLQPVPRPEIQPKPDQRPIPKLDLPDFPEEAPPSFALKAITQQTTLRRQPLLVIRPVVTARQVPVLPPLNLPVDAPPPPQPSRPAPTPTRDESPEQEASELTFDVQTEDAVNTSLKVYFTDGKGTFYRTEPEMVIKSSQSGQLIKSAYRNVMSGEPVPIEIPAGTYDIEIPGSRASAHQVVLEANKTNKVYILAGQGSLSFHYPTNKDKPVREYLALVSKRFEGGKVVKHPCDEVKLYDPTNYHIEINTLPPLSYNIDLSFNAIKVVAIPEPGTVKITNTSNMGKVQFWYEKGNRFVPFYEMHVVGTPTRQQADFLPGKYQVRYFKRLDASTQKVEVMHFNITRRQTTEIFLPE